MNSSNCYHNITCHPQCATLQEDYKSHYCEQKEQTKKNETAIQRTNNNQVKSFWERNDSKEVYVPAVIHLLQFI